MLLISRSMGLWKICISSLCSIDTSGRIIIYSLSPFRGNNNVVVFPIPFHIFIPLANLWFIPPSWIVSYPKDKKFPWPLPAHPPSEKAVGIWQRKNAYPGIYSVPSYVIRERKIGRDMLTTNPMQGQVRFCRRRKREENHMSGP